MYTNSPSDPLGLLFAAAPLSRLGSRRLSTAKPGGRSFDFSVAGKQHYEVRYEAKKTGRSAASVKKAGKKVGNTRKKVERRLGR